MIVKKGDLVQVISGRDLGKQGKVEAVITQENRVVVSGVNLRKRHLKPNRTQPKGGIVEMAAPLNRSNVMVVCPHCSKLTRGHMTLTDSAKYRACTNCNDSLDTK